MTVVSTRGVTPESIDRPPEGGYWNAAVPSLCIVPFQQHAGSRLTSLVRSGELVREGMVIAESQSRLAVPMHAPIPGRVATVGETVLLDGTRSQAIAIELDGEFDRLGKAPEALPWKEMSSQDLLEIIHTAGVVCGPRSAVPAHLHLRPRANAAAPVLILDVAETEPYLSAGAEIATAEADAITEGLEIIAHIIGAEQIHAVVAARFRSAYRALRRSDKEIHLRLHRVPHQYPANTEHGLRRAAGLRPGKEDEVEAVVVSPATVAGVRDAVRFRKPQIDQVITVGGGAVRRPAHIRVRIGTSIAEALQECGGLIADPARIIAGGTLTGQHVQHVNAPITKSVHAIVALTEAEVRAGEEEPCIGCGTCVRACPVSVNPSLLNDLIADGRYDQAVAERIFDCTECGLCAHVCPSRIPLVDRIRGGKRAVEAADQIEEES